MEMRFLRHLIVFSAAALIEMFNFTGAAIIPGDTTNIQCHKWFNVLDDLQQNLFNGGQCNDLARQALRITFHDAIGYSAALFASGTYGGGGADGSLIKFASIELKSPANKGLETIVHALKHIADRHNVTYGDIIQFAGAVGFSNCPGSPRLAFYAGRPDAAAPAPPNLFPSPTDSAQKILTRMADAGFSAEDTVVLLGAHSISVQRTTDPTILGAPFDSTPKLFDTQFYLETLLKGTAYPGNSKYKSKGEAKSALPGQFRIASDAAIARHPLTACKWQSFVGNQKGLRTSFHEAMMKLGTQGHQNLYDCSSVIPRSQTWVPPPAYPAGKSYVDIEQSCPRVPFPALPSRSGTN